MSVREATIRGLLALVIAAPLLALAGSTSHAAPYAPGEGAAEEAALRTPFPKSLSVRAQAHDRGRAVVLAAEARAAGMTGSMERRADAVSLARAWIEYAHEGTRGYHEPDELFSAQEGRLPRPAGERPLNAGFGPRARSTSDTRVRHNGLSWAMPTGAPVMAVARGVVFSAEFIPGMGGVVVIAHGSGWHTVYAQLVELQVRPGQAVVSESLIGLGGNISTFGMPEIYFEIRHDGIAIDPTSWLRPRQGRVPQH